MILQNYGGHMKSKLTNLGLSISCLMFLYCPDFFATEYFVSPSGSDTIGVGTIVNPWRTIEYALNNIYPGDVLLLREGIYNEQLISVRSGNMSNYITISAYNNENAIIDGTGVATGNNGAIISHSFLKFMNFTIRNWADAGMEIFNCEFIELINLKITTVTGGIHLTGTTHDFILDSCVMYDYYGGAGGFGFDATPEGISDSIYNGKIKNCKAYLTVPAFDNCDGFALGHDGVSKIQFYNCEVSGVGDAFDISGKDIILERCSAHGSTYGGGYKLWRDNVTLINCIGYNNTSNVELDFDFDVYKGVKARLINCTFFGSTTYNLWIENSAGGSKLEMFNCILAGGNHTGLNFDGDSISCYTGDYNLFHMNNPERMIVTSEYDFSSTQVQNGEWAAYSGQDAHSKVDFNSGSIFMDTLASKPDLHLVDGSLAIDNGINLPDAPLVDFDNCLRNVGQIDIGAHEFGTSEPSGILDEFSENRHSFYIYQNYPNPFNPNTKIRYTIPNRGVGYQHVHLAVYDILGNEVVTLVDEEKSQGSYEVEFIGNHLTSGIYFYRLDTIGFIETKKMILLR
jgi:hypothetical protein